MNRADLHWALDSVLPHVGRTRGQTVGLQSHAGRLFAYASDGYSAGIARLDGPLNWNLHLAKSEATDLMRFVRPSLKAHYDEVLRTTVRDDSELHIATEQDSEVFELTTDELSLGYLLDAIERTSSLPAERRELILQPPLVAKFAKAQREDTDRMRLYPFRPQDRNGVAIVTVGTDFIGLVAGMEYDDQEGVTLTSFLQNAEHDERNVA